MSLYIVNVFEMIYKIIDKMIGSEHTSVIEMMRQNEKSQSE